MSTEINTKWLRDELKKRGWKQKQLAEKAGLSRQTIGKILTGDNYPTTPTCRKIAEALDMPLYAFLKAMNMITTKKNPQAERISETLKDLSPQQLDAIEMITKALLKDRE